MNIFIGGDFCPNYRVAEMLSKQDFSFFDNVKDIISNVDYSIVNFECPIVNGNVLPINKCGPALHTVPAAVDALKYADFDCVTLANNHFRDYGDEGCITTLSELENANIDYVGGGRNIIEAQKILYKEFGNKKLAIINFCENEFSIASDCRAGAAPLDAVDNYNQITEARRNADYVLVIVHGGHEHFQLPSPRMKKLYRHFVTIGADAVVNHHQHCYSGYEYYKGKPIFYGLGNFCFDWEKRVNCMWNEGYGVSIEFGSQISFKIHPIKQGGNSVEILLLRGVDKITFNNNISRLNKIIAQDNELKNEFENLLKVNKKSVQTVFSSYHNRYLNAAANRGILPRPSSIKEINSCINYVQCESHRDIVIGVLTDLIKNK